MGAGHYMTLAAAVATILTRFFVPSLELTSSIPIQFVFYLFSFAFLYFFWTIIIYRNFLDPLLQTPGVPGARLISGHVNEVLNRAPDQPPGEAERRWMEKTPNNGLIRCCLFLREPRVIPTTTKGLSEVLVTKCYDFEKPGPVRSFLSRILGVGLLIAEGDIHKRQRKLLTPAFSFRHVKDLYADFWHHSNTLTECLNKHLKTVDPNEDGEKLVEIQNWSSRVTLDIIGTTGFGRSFDSLHDPDNELARAYKSIFSMDDKVALVWAFITLNLPPWIVKRIPSKRNNTLAAGAAKIRETARDLIRQKRQNLEKGQARTDYDIVSIAMESGGFTDDELVDQAMTFLAAGHETTSAAVTWIAYHLCTHLEVQERLRNELREKLPAVRDSSLPVTSIDIDHLPYLNAVINEALRFTPPAPNTVRCAARDTTILDYPIPKGTVVLLSPWAFNRNKELWGPDACEFNPDRWMQPGAANSGGAENNYALMTFLHGPRSCIGSQFARAEAACIVAALFGRFEMTFPKAGYSFDHTSDLTTKPKNLFVNMKPILGD